VTEIVKVTGRGHALTIDAGWREVAEKALAFVKRFAWQLSSLWDLDNRGQFLNGIISSDAATHRMTERSRDV
jgi:hypothetical protein